MEYYLEEWGFQDLIPVFQEQEIDDEALLCLNDDAIKESIPKVGPRMKFLAKLKDHQKLQSMPIISLDELKSQQDALSPESVFSVPTPEELVASPSTSVSSANSTANDNVIFDTPEAITTAYNEVTTRPRAAYGYEQFKRACRTVYSFDLEEFLEKTATGRFILNSYRKDKRLTRTLRSQLTYIVVSGLMSENGGAALIPLDFEILTQKICDLFPTETQGTYYIPRVSGKKNVKPINAKGKLIDKYRNLTRLYNVQEKNNDPDEAVVGTSASANIEQLKNCCKWLKSWQEPWDLVFENWKKTFPLRKNIKIATVESYLSEWPILKHKDAYHLIEYDFQQLFPNTNITSLLQDYDKWEHFFNALKSIKVLDPSTEQFLQSLTDEDVCQDSKNAVQVAALSMLFPPATRIRVKKTHWKPSILECQESLINLVSASANIDECILKRRQKLGALNLTLQPFVIVVGASFTEVTDSYLVIDNYTYKTISVLQALDFAFKAFNALNINYPKECEHIWVLVERALYKIQSTTAEIPAVLTILQELQNFT